MERWVNHKGSSPIVSTPPYRVGVPELVAESNAPHPILPSSAKGLAPA